ncbi:LOG family protein [Capilliphycus salinus ALCB114379]|uniref:LOG family protein n=1 Tax=Capilliphycus salinus TaxID=2768948 RepID=UPI0039A4F54B
MDSSGTNPQVDSLQAEMQGLIDQLPGLKHEKWISRALSSLVRMAAEEFDTLDWKILSASLLDMERGFQIFYPYRHVRKICIFGSARTSPEAEEYQMAANFARSVCQQGFMVLTGAGGGIMQAGNEGAGPERSFGLNIQLPFEQTSNPFIEGDRKLINFKYFFTRKLFFLRESDALAMFPGGFGTLDETFECLTLAQTGKFGPAPLVLIDHPGGDYWHDWHAFIEKQLLRRRLISADDRSIYTITDNIETACKAISDFYRVYHSSRYVKELLVIRLKSELSDEDVEKLNDEFGDILVQGKIEKSPALAPEAGDESEHLPRLVLHFNQLDIGRLYQLISTINTLGATTPETSHPEQK